MASIVPLSEMAFLFQSIDDTTIRTDFVRGVREFLGFPTGLGGAFHRVKKGLFTIHPFYAISY